MTDRTYRLPWIIAAAVLLLGTALVGLSLRSRLYETAHSDASWQARKLLQSSQDVLRLSGKETETRVAGAASLGPVRILVAADVDKATFEDAFHTERWWASIRADFPVQILAFGNSQLDLTPEPVSLKVDSLLAAVRRKSPASQILVAKGAAYVAAAAPIEVTTKTPREPVFLILARPLSPKDFTPASDIDGAAVLAVDRIGLFGVGRTPRIQHLQELIRRPDSGAAVGSDAEWAAANVEVAPQLELWVEAGTADKVRELTHNLQTVLYPIWGIGALLAGICLYIGIGRRSRHRQPLQKDLVLSDSYAEASELPAAFQPRNSEPLLRLEPSEASELPPAFQPRNSELLLRLEPSDPSPASVESVPDSKQFGRYRLLHTVGEGDATRAELAVVQGAQDFNRFFVIKRLPQDLASQPAAVSEFIERAQIASSLVHSNIVPICDFGRVGDQYFVAQEYVLGRDLELLVRRAKESDGVLLPPPLVFYIAQEALKALTYAHSQRNSAGEPAPVVHGNICPKKIWLSATGEVKLLDFGLSHSTTQTFFLSPEQARGEAVEPRSDLFSLALTLFWSLTGRLLYNAISPKELIERLAGPATPVLRPALEADPAERFQTAEQFARAIPPWDPSDGQERLQSLMRHRFARDFQDELIGRMGWMTSAFPTRHQLPWELKG